MAYYYLIRDCHESAKNQISHRATEITQSIKSAIAKAHWNSSNLCETLWPCVKKYVSKVIHINTKARRNRDSRLVFFHPPTPNRENSLKNPSISYTV